MPNKDGTGPFGDGRPGRGLGPCGRFGTRQSGGFRRGMGRGFRRGWRFQGGWRQDLAPAGGTDVYEYSLTSLEEQKADLEEQMKWIMAQIAKLKEEKQ